MQPAGVRHRRSKAEVADRELGSSSQSIEVQAKARTRVSKTHKSHTKVPAGIRPAGAETDRRESARALMSGDANQSMEPMGMSDIDEARRVSEQERANQSKPKFTHVPKCHRLAKSWRSFPAGIEPTVKV